MIFIYAKFKKLEKKNKFKLVSFDFNKTLLKKYHNIKFIKFNNYYKADELLNSKIEKNYKIQLNNIYRLFNKKFSKNYSLKNYETIFGYWLIHYLSQFFFKELLINQVKSKYKFLKINYCSNIVPYNNSEFYDLLKRSYFQNYLFSEVLEYKNIKNVISFDSQKNIDQILQKNPGSFKKKIKRFLYNLLVLLKPKVIIAEPHFKNKSILNSIKVIFNSKFKIMFNDFISPNFNRKNVINGKLSFSITEENYLSNKKLFKLIIKNIPYLDFYLLNKDVGKYYSNLRFTNIFVSFNSHYYNSLFSHYIAFRKKTLKLYLVQHGAGWGIEKNSLTEKFDLSISNKFFYMGSGQYNQNKNVLSYPNNFYKKIDWKQKSNILFVTTARHKFFVRPVFTADVRNYFTSDKEILYDFYKNIRFKNSLCFRLHGIKNYSNNNFFKLLKGKKINIDQNKNIYQSFKDTKICIYDHLGTSFLESMQLSIPSIIILNDSSSKYYNKNFIKMFDMLVKNKFIYFSTKDACKFINDNFMKINEWWNCTDTINTKNIFVNSYSYYVKNWYENWRNNFLNE